MSDTLKGYTLVVFDSEEGIVGMECDRCGDPVTKGHLLALAVLVRAATEHSGRCLG